MAVFIYEKPFYPVTKALIPQIMLQRRVQVTVYFMSAKTMRITINRGKTSQEYENTIELAGGLMFGPCIICSLFCSFFTFSMLKRFSWLSSLRLIYSRTK